MEQAYETLYERADFSPLDYPFKKIIDGVTVHCTTNMDADELKAYVNRGRGMWIALTDVFVKVEGDEVELGYITEDHAFERIRRITGYLSGTVDRFNDAKKAEVAERVKHKVEYA